MCDWLGSSKDDAASKQALANLATNQATAAAALAAQQQAADQAKAAADSASETTRLGTERRLRKLLAAGPFGAALPTDYGAAPVATRQLYGA